MNKRYITYLSPSALQPYPRNPRTHSKRQIRQIADSIKEFGFTNPVLIDRDGGIIAGHGRVEAAKLLGIDSVPTIRLEDMTEAQKRAYILADNKLAENAGWDRELLALELQYLTELDIDFDLTITGFETTEIDLLIEGLEPAEDDPAADSVPESDPDAPVISQVGDLWLLGPHRILCGDATNPDSFKRLMGGQTAQMVFIDPPYNVAIDGHVCGLGSIRHEEFAMASGEMSEAEFTEFLRGVFGHLIEYSMDGSIHYVCMDWRHIHELLTAGRSAYTEIKNLCVWNKDNGGMGSFYRSKHELVFVFKNGTEPHINNFELGQNGRYRTNVWNYPGVNSLREGRLDDLAMHPTVKPVALVADAMLDCSRRGGIVLDGFGGSGTTLIAAEKTGRKAYAMELDPKYVDTAIRRWQEYTGEEATHAESGRTFDDIHAERRDEKEADNGE
jgi:DNA modification methylase